MKLRALASLGILFAFVTAASAEVRMVVKDGRRFIYNDGPANIRASEEWLAARVQRASDYDGMIDAAALANDVDPKLVKSVMLVESGFNPNAVSKKGARGLMQLMPETAAEVGVRNIHDPAQNIAGGVRYLSQLLLNYRGDLTKTLAAYRGKSVLGGGFGKPSDETYRGTPVKKGKSVQWTRDERTNRITLTTKSKTAARRLG